MAIQGAASRTDLRDTIIHWLRSLRTRTMWVVIITVIYSLILISSVVALMRPPQLLLMLSQPANGVVRIAWVLPGGTFWSAGVRAGDLVVTLNDRRPIAANRGSWAGQRVEVLTATGASHVFDASIIRRNHDTWPLLLLSPWFFLLSVLIFSRARQATVGNAAFACFASAAFALALAPATDHDWPILAAAEHMMLPLFALCFLLLFLVFPIARGSTHLYTLLLSPPSVIAALSLIALVEPVLYELASMLRSLVLLSYLLGGAALAIYSFTTSNECYTRTGLSIVGSGTALSVLPFVALYLIPSTMGKLPIMSAEHAILPIALLPASFAHAILRHHVLDVSLLQRWLVRALLWGLMLVLVSVIVYTRHWLFGALPEPLHSLVLAAVLVLLSVSFGWLGTRVQIFADRLIFKDSYDYRAALRALSHDLSAAEDLTTLGNVLPGTLCRLMNLDFALLLIKGQQGADGHEVVGTYDPTMLPSLKAAVDRVQTEPQTVRLASSTILLVPLRTHDSTVGHLCLGPKSNGEPFRAEDRDLLVTLGGQIAAIVHATQLVVELRKQVHILDTLNERLEHAQEEERVRLAADIHDEPLQTAIHLQRQLATAQPPNATLNALSYTLVDQLRRVSAALRPAVLDDLGLYAGLNELTQEQSDRFGVAVLLDISPDIVDSMLPPATELVLYRAAQEAITNCVRHAHAHTIRLTVGWHAEMVRLTVVDDGSGFVVPTRFDQLVTAGHLGLAGLGERVQRAGGRLRISSTLGEGTSLQVELPLRKGRADARCAG
ncbi:MAG: GAF domain-containing sensor histidine kinase [Herpetosiphonaceae bacterium]|nr:GAF domain-containing sensor histidine kinase [Herpetosiphonaceae bacterium]